jgi:ATP-dependent helicase/nuclease subunit B
MAWAETRRPGIVRAQLEKSAVISLPTTAGAAELKAKADRIELLKDGSLAIIDFKTGAPRSAKQVQSGIEPQLPLEAAIARRTAFGDIGPATTSQLIYFQISTSSAVLKDKNGQALTLDDPIDEVAEAALKGLQKLIGLYSQPDQPFLSRPRVFSVKIFGDFDRLARRSEWTVEEGEE